MSAYTCGGAMVKSRIEFHSEGFIELMKSQPVGSFLLQEAEKVATRAGEHYAAWPGTGGRTRTRAFVSPSDAQGRIDNARHATLLRALGR